ncbi:hypothetical protein [Rhodococcus opacus]|uniref:DNA primase n=1 Tax=Rhodococcus opacus TaxID=37919 RepID=A0A2S8I5H8_RHOOP|nr:hypothetical protein [Rhodococcus opacus]PQP10044.1 hypothetical protein C5613_44045 [Rhodococcus opacus]
MNNKTQMAAAIGAGYLLGRTRRMKLALMLAGAGTAGRFPGGPRELLTLGTKMLANSPEVAKLGDTVRGELLGAAKAAAVTAASQRIDSLSNRLQSGGQEITGTVSDLPDNVSDVNKVGRFGRKKRTRSRDDDEQPSVDEQPEDDSAGEEDEADEEPAPRKRPTPRRRASGTGSTRPASRSRTAKSDEDDEEAPARKRRTRAKATTDSAPVRRARR